jgi:hypothetical protein
LGVTTLYLAVRSHRTSEPVLNTGPLIARLRPMSHIVTHEPSPLAGPPKLRQLPLPLLLLSDRPNPLCADLSAVNPNLLQVLKGIEIEPQVCKLYESGHFLNLVAGNIQHVARLKLSIPL